MYANVWLKIANFSNWRAKCAGQPGLSTVRRVKTPKLLGGGGPNHNPEQATGSKCAGKEARTCFLAIMLATVFQFFAKSFRSVIEEHILKGILRKELAVR